MRLAEEVAAGQSPRRSRQKKLQTPSLELHRGAEERNSGVTVFITVRVGYGCGSVAIRWVLRDAASFCFNRRSFDLVCSDLELFSGVTIL